MKCNLILFIKRLHSFMPHLITTYAIFKCCILSMKLCPWPCALGVTGSSYWKADVADLITVPMTLPLRLALVLFDSHPPSTISLTTHTTTGLVLAMHLCFVEAWVRTGSSPVGGAAGCSAHALGSRLTRRRFSRRSLSPKKSLHRRSSGSRVV
jgi:hypothetical protein